LLCVGAELIESCMYLYQATKDPFLLEVAVEMLEAIEHSTKTLCGYATVRSSSSSCSSIKRVRKDTGKSMENPGF